MRTRIAAAMTALALLLFPLGAVLLVSRSFDLTMARERERALSEEAAIARAVTMEIADAQKDVLFSLAAGLQARYGSATLSVVLLYHGQPMAGARLPDSPSMLALTATQGRATLLDGDAKTLYIAHRLGEELTLLLASDVSAVYRLRRELAVWAGILSVAGVLLSALLATIASGWLARPYKKLAQERQALIDAMAHEMRTPLTAILGGVRLLEGGKVGAAQRDALLSMMAKETKRLTDMDERLLMLTRLDHSAAQFSPFSSMEMAKEALAAFDGVGLSGEDAQLIGERELIIQLLRNLVVNARRAGGSEPVRVTLTENGFRVTDCGCGMTREEMTRVFEPFYRADRSRARAAGGAGLGLTLCRKIARLHGGELSIQSCPGKGTTVTFAMKARSYNLDTSR